MTFLVSLDSIVRCRRVSLTGGQEQCQEAKLKQEDTVRLVLQWRVVTFMFAAPGPGCNCVSCVLAPDGTLLAVLLAMLNNKVQTVIPQLHPLLQL